MLQKAVQEEEEEESTEGRRDAGDDLLDSSEGFHCVLYGEVSTQGNQKGRHWRGEEED